ncbi:MAG: formate--tetrahydrofolate ligase, partial [Oscillospiraceae bacterium]
GIANLDAHIENMQLFGVPVVVAINKFGTDTQAEIEFVSNHCTEKGVTHAYSDVFSQGADGGVDLANAICNIVDNQIENNFAPIYDVDSPITDKIEKICKSIYHAGNVRYENLAKKAIEEIELLHLEKLPICIAKTQYSLSDNQSLLGSPSGFDITVKNIKVSAGAGFIIVYTGSIMTMPGLPKTPAAMQIDVNENGVIDGLF